jgi:hypothetical protein
MRRKCESMKLISGYTLNALLFVVVAGSSVSSPADSNYYRWMDSQGNPIHSDIPPPAGIDYEIVSTQSTFSRAIESQEGAVPLEGDSTVGTENTQQASAEAGRYEKEPELCQIARTNLDSLTNSAKVKTRNELGEVRYLSAEEMEVQRQTAQAQIGVYCE